MITNAVNVGTTLIAIALIDRVGRKRLLLVGSSGMVVMLTTLTVIFGTAPQVANGEGGTEPSLVGLSSTMAVLAFNAYVFFFGMSWGPVVWVLLGEIFPNTIRVRALGVAAAAQWVANFLVAVTFPLMAAVSLPLTYGMYALFAALSFVFVLTKIPETNGMSLDEANTLLPPKNSAKKAANQREPERVPVSV